MKLDERSEERGLAERSDFREERGGVKAEKKKFDLGPADSKQRRKTKNQRPKSVPAETRLPAGTGRNGRNGPERAEILAEVERRGASYRLACQYEIFRPFRPERNGLYNTGQNSSF